MHQITKINSKLEHLDDIQSYQDLQAYLQGEYQVMIRCFDQICFGEYKEDDWHMEAGKPAFETIQDIRIFNSDMELYLWRASSDASFKQADQLKGRIRRDDQGDECSMVEAEQILIGSKIKEINENGYVTIREDRGFELKIPSTWLPKQVRNSCPLKLTSRNYLQQWDNGQLSYYDHRFVSIKKKED